MLHLLNQAKTALDGIAEFGFPDPKGKAAGAFYRLDGGEFSETFDSAQVTQLGLEFVARATDPDALLVLWERIAKALRGRFSITNFKLGDRAPGGVLFELRVGLYFK